MKIFTLMMAALAMTHVLSAEDEGAHLFILAGQSNMRALKPEVSFTPAVEKAFGADSVIVVKDAENGQSIRRWCKQWKPAEGKNAKNARPEQIGDLYDRLMAKVNAAIKDRAVATVTFIWMQGESDRFPQNAAVYEASLKGVIEQINKELEIDDLNIVIGRISDYGVVKNNQHWQTIREIQVKVAESAPSGAWVDTDDLNDISKNGEVRHDLHYTKEGSKILGERFAQKAIELIHKK